MNLFSQIKEKTSFQWKNLYVSKRNIIIVSVSLVLAIITLSIPTYILPATKEYVQAQQVKKDAKDLQKHLQTASSKLEELTELRRTSPFKTKIQSNNNSSNKNDLAIVAVAYAQSPYDASQLQSYIRHAEQTTTLSNELLSEIEAIKENTVKLQQEAGNPNRYVDEHLYAEALQEVKETDNTIKATYELATFYSEYGKASALFATGIALVEIQLQQKQEVQNSVVVAQKQLQDANEILASINKNEAFPEDLRTVSSQTQQAYTQLSQALSQLISVSKKNPDTQVVYVQQEIVGQLAIDYEKWREIESQVLDQDTINRFNAKAKELSQKIEQANQNQVSNLQVVLKVFTKEEAVNLSSKPSGFQTFRGFHIDNSNNPIALPGQKVTITNKKTGEAVSTTDTPNFFAHNLTPGVMYRVVADPIPGYQISNMVCYNCSSPAAYSYNNGNVFEIDIPENTYYGVYFKYIKGDNAQRLPTTSPIQIDDLGISISGIRTNLAIKAGESQPAFTITSTGSSGISMYGYPTTYGPGINWNISSAGLTAGRSIEIKVQVNNNIPAGTYKGSAIIISYPSQKRYTIPNIEVTVQKETTTNPTPTSGSNSDTTPTPTSGGTTSPTPTPAQAPFGLQASASSVNLTIEEGKSTKAFDITSTGATQFSLYGYPTNYGPGINWSVSSGGISNGQSVPVEISVNSGINPGTYSGNAIVKDQSGAQISIPVKVTVVRTQVSRFVKVTSPNGGEALKVGDKVNISWEGNDIDKCNVGYSFGLGSLNNINPNVSTTGNGSYEWTVNIGNTANTQVKIDLLCYKTGVGQVSDQSDNFFTVNP